MSPVERMIVVAIIGILMSVILPNLQRTSRRARTSRPRAATHAASRYRAPEPAGRSNTIDVSRATSPGMGTGRAPVARAIGALLRFLVILGVIIIIAVSIKRSRKHAPG
jgi:hypothetical protein